MTMKQALGGLTSFLLALAAGATGFASNPAHVERPAGQTAVATPAAVVDFDSPRWQVSDPNARREEYLGRKSLYLTSGFAVLKDAVFEDGVIEVDVATTGKTSF